jgi:hypothetical protein
MAIICKKDGTIQVGDKTFPARMELKNSKIDSMHDLDIFFKINNIEIRVTKNDKCWERDVFAEHYNEIKEKLAELLQALNDLRKQMFKATESFVQTQKRTVARCFRSVMQSLSKLLNDQFKAIEEIKNYMHEVPKPAAAEKQVERLRRIVRESKLRCSLLNLPENDRISKIREDFLGKGKLEVYEAVESSNFEIIPKHQLEAMKNEYIRLNAPVLFDLLAHYQERLRAAALRAYAVQKGILAMFAKFGIKVSREMTEQLDCVYISNEAYVPDEKTLEVSIAA